MPKARKVRLVSNADTEDYIRENGREWRIVNETPEGDNVTLMPKWGKQRKITVPSDWVEVFGRR